MTVPALAASGVRTAIELVRERDPGLLGAPAWWGFDICVLWACFHAFGSAPPFTVILMSYFLGMVGNLLPLPGGLGGVEGGMIGAFAAFGVNLDQAVLAVLAYRAISFWLPTVPGAIAYFQLRRTVARWRSEQAAPKSAASEADRDRWARFTPSKHAILYKVKRVPVRPWVAQGMRARRRRIGYLEVDGAREGERENELETGVSEMAEVENTIIIGSGPAGYTAALYTSRANLSPLVVEGFAWGGLLQQTTDVENYPGFPEGIMGPDLMMKLREQAERFGATLETDQVERVELADEPGGVHKRLGRRHRASVRVP